MDTDYVLGIGIIVFLVSIFICGLIHQIYSLCKTKKNTENIENNDIEYNII
jgi:hypothetical protein